MRARRGARGAIWGKIERACTRSPATSHHADFPSVRLVAAKRGRLVSVCIPSRNEAATVAGVVHAVIGPHLAEAGGSGLVDEVLVVDDASSDDTAAVAEAAGARVVRLAGSGGKGEAMAAGVEASVGDVVVFLDADVENTTAGFVSGPWGRS